MSANQSDGPKNARTAHANQLHRQEICVCIHTDVLWCKRVSSWRFGKYTHLPPAEPAWVSIKGILLNISVKCLTPGSSYTCVYITSAYPEWNLHRVKSIGVLFLIYMGPSCHAMARSGPATNLDPAMNYWICSAVSCGKATHCCRSMASTGFSPSLPSSLQHYQVVKQDVHFTLFSSLLILQTFFLANKSNAVVESSREACLSCHGSVDSGARRLQEGCVWGGIISRHYFGEAMYI